jgi:hydroxylamine dehydrogenase
MMYRLMTWLRSYQRPLIAVAGLGVLGVAAFGLFYPNGSTYLKRAVEKPAFIYRTTGAQTCEGCHRTLDPGIDLAWRKSVHYKVNVGCADCHGDDHEAVFAAKGKVSAGACGQCHDQVVKDYAGSAHAQAEVIALSDARFIAQSTAMQDEGCMMCHATGTRFADGSVGGCNECHPGHEFSAEFARQPEACEVCHGGPDHPVSEAYRTSVHGTLYLLDRDAEKYPNCVSCHMPKGFHGHVANMTLGQVLNGAVLEDQYYPAIPMKRISREEFDENRKEMLAVCAPCHGTRFSRESLERADQIKKDADQILAEARAVIQSLYDDKMLDPMPEDRRPNPVTGHALELGGQQLYEDTSEIEQAFFRLFKFYHPTTFKGAYHNSPDYTHWKGIVFMKMELDKIRSEAKKLRQAGAE